MPNGIKVPILLADPVKPPEELTESVIPAETDDPGGQVAAVGGKQVYTAETLMRKELGFETPEQYVLAQKRDQTFGPAVGGEESVSIISEKHGIPEVESKRLIGLAWTDPKAPELKTLTPGALKDIQLAARGGARYDIYLEEYGTREQAQELYESQKAAVSLLQSKDLLEGKDRVKSEAFAVAITDPKIRQALVDVGISGAQISEGEARVRAAGVLDPYTTKKGTDVVAALQAGVSEKTFKQAGFTTAQLGRAGELLAGIKSQKRAVEALEPYHVPGEVMAPGVYGPARPAGYDISAALGAGVLPATLVTAGFSGKQISAAQELLIPTSLEIPSKDISGGPTAAFELAKPDARTWYQKVGSFFTGRLPEGVEGELAPGSEFLKTSILGFFTGLGKGEAERKGLYQMMAATGHPEFDVPSKTFLPRGVEIASVLPGPSLAYQWPILTSEQRRSGLVTAGSRTFLLAAVLGAGFVGSGSVRVPTVRYQVLPRTGVATLEKPGIPPEIFGRVSTEAVYRAPTVGEPMYVRMPISAEVMSPGGTLGTYSQLQALRLGGVAKVTTPISSLVPYKYVPSTLELVTGGKVVPPQVLGGPKIPISPPLQFVAGGRVLSLPRAGPTLGGSGVSIYRPTTATMTSEQLAGLQGPVAVTPSFSPYLLPGLGFFTITEPYPYAVPSTVPTPTKPPMVPSPIVSPILGLVPGISPGKIPSYIPTSTGLLVPVPKEVLAPGTTPSPVPTTTPTSAPTSAPITTPTMFPTPFFPTSFMPTSFIPTTPPTRFVPPIEGPPALLPSLGLVALMGARTKKKGLKRLLKGGRWAFPGLEVVFTDPWTLGLLRRPMVSKRVRKYGAREAIVKGVSL